MPTIDNSETWTKTSGDGGLPRWVYTIVGTYDQATKRELDDGSYLASEVKFRKLPYQSQLTAMSVKGETLIPVTISPPGFDTGIANCIKLRVSAHELVAPVGGWAANPTYQVVRYTYFYQQLEDNEV